MFAGDTRLEWHRAIRTLAWVFGWAGIAIDAAILDEFLVSGRELPAHLVRIGARAAVIAALMSFAVPLFTMLELWWSAVQHARRGYAQTLRKRLVAIYTAVVLVVVALYAVLPLWLLPRMWRGLSRWAAAIEPRWAAAIEPRWAAAIEPLHLGKRAPAGPGAVAGIVAGCVAAAGLLLLLGYPTVRNYAACIRKLGLRQILRGVAMMVLLRIRQPRRDFFKMTPLIADAFPLVLCVAVYEVLPASAFTALLALLLAAADAAMSLDRIRPPTWLFLGTSEYESFWVFNDLRHNWDRTAVGLLDRSSKEGYKFYQAERESWSRNGGLPANLFYDPTQPRVWDLRTRPSLWGHTVVLLIDFVPDVVVDLRRASDFVLNEVQWLADPSRIGKALFLVDEEQGLLPEYAAVIPPSARDRVLTGPALYARCRRK